MVVTSWTPWVRRGQRWLLDNIVTHYPALGLDRRAESFAALFEKDLAPRSLVLDIGGGWGFYAEPLRRRGHQLTVLDVVRPGFQKAPVVLYDGTGRFPFADASFDACLLVTVLHHIDRPERVLAEARRVTRGKLILIEDVYHHPAGRIWTQLRDQFYNMEFVGHPCRFKKGDAWASMIEASGFRIERREEVRTRLAGLGILNEMFVCEAGAARPNHL